MFELVKTIIAAHKKLAAAVLAGSLALLLVVGLFASRVYEARSSIYVHRKIMEASDGTGLPDSQSASLGDHVKIIRSDMVMGVMTARLRKEFPNHEKLSGEMLAERLRMVNGKQTKVIDLSFQDSDRRYAARVLALALEGYEKALRDITDQTRKKSSQYLEGRLTAIQKEKGELARELAKVESRLGSTDIAMKNQQLLLTHTDYRTRLQQVNAGLAATAQEIGKLKKTLDLSGQDIKALSRVREDENLRVLQAELGQHQSELAALQSVYTDNYKDVVEKKRAVDNLESRIQKRLKELYGGQADDMKPFFSPVEETLGQKLLDLEVTRLGLISQKRVYERLLASLGNEFDNLVVSKREIETLRSKLDSLKNEEEKILAKLQDNMLEHDIVSNLGLFTVITPPEVPAQGDYIFPPRPNQLFLVSILGSLLLAMFSVAVAEFLDPKVFSLSEATVFAEINRFGKAVRVDEVQAVYHNLSMYIRRAGLRTVALFHLCGATGAGEGYQACPYSPSVFARQLATMFAEKNFRILLVDCSDTYSHDEDAREKLAHYPDYVLYRYSGIELLDILSPSTPAGSVFDPNILNMLPEVENYDLILLNVSLSDNDLATSLICETADATVMGISRSGTPARLMARFQKTARERQINMIGSIIFP